MKKGRFRGQFLRINYGCPIDPDSWYTIKCKECIYHINKRCTNYGIFLGGFGATGHYVLNRNTEGN